MRFWDFIFGERKMNSTYELLIDTALRTASAITVSPQMALRCTPVYCGVRVRSETLGSLPVHLYQRDGESKKRATDHPLYRLLHDRPNAWTSATEFVTQLEMDCITDGAGYALANRSGDRIVELIRLDPGAVTVEYDLGTLEPRYRVSLKSGGQKIYPWTDILHVPTLGCLSAIKQAREAIGLCLAMEMHAAGLFGNGGRPSGILKYKGHASQSMLDSLRKSWNKRFTGETSGSTAILEEGMDFEPLTFNSVDLQFQELRAFQVVEISRALGVPPNLLFDFGRATWANAEEMGQAFLSFTILPRIKCWQGAISRLLSADEQQKFYPEFMVDELVKADISARFSAYASAISSRILNPNEARAKENLPPYHGGDEFANPNVQPSTAPAPQPAVRPRPRAIA